MNLIEKLGLEKCKWIVDGAPEGAIQINQTPNYFKNIKYPYCEMWNPYDQKWFETEVFSFDEFIRLSDIRTALADHSSKLCQHGYDIACLICGFGTENGVRVWRKQIETNNVTDIRNHISPNTKVTER